MLGVDHTNSSVVFNKTAQTSALRTTLRKRSLLGFVCFLFVFFNKPLFSWLPWQHVTSADSTTHMLQTQNTLSEKFLSHFADWRKQNGTVGVSRLTISTFRCRRGSIQFCSSQYLYFCYCRIFYTRVCVCMTSAVYSKLL